MIVSKTEKTPDIAALFFAIPAAAIVTVVTVATFGFVV